MNPSDQLAKAAELLRREDATLDSAETALLARWIDCEVDYADEYGVNVRALTFAEAVIAKFS